MEDVVIPHGDRRHFMHYCNCVRVIGQWGKVIGIWDGLNTCPELDGLNNKRLQQRKPLYNECVTAFSSVEIIFVPLDKEKTSKVLTKGTL